MVQQAIFNVFGFHSTHDALAAQRLLSQNSLQPTTLPRPQELGGASCGIGIRISPSYTEEAQSLFASAGIVYEGPIQIIDYCL